jgi:hypothetical protein
VTVCAATGSPLGRVEIIKVAVTPHKAAAMSQYAGAALSCVRSISHVDTAGVKPPNSAGSCRS